MTRPEAPVETASRNARARRRAWAASVAVALVTLAACTLSTGMNSNGPTYSIPSLIFLLNTALGGRGNFQPRAKAQAPAAGSYVLGSSTPFLPFAGNRLVVADPLSVDRTTVASAILQRAANCSLTETVFQRVNGQYDASSSLDLPNAQDYLHQVSGLTTQADVFPNGCVDSARGKRAVNTALPLGVTASSIRFADLNPSSEQLEVRTADRTTGALTTVALTPGRVSYFLVVDINGDGLPDIVASGVGYGVGTTGSVVVFLNNGNGTFRTAATIASTGANFTVDDLDGDGKPDIVIDNGYDSTGTPIPGVSTLLGRGDGTFAAAVVSATGVAGASGPFITGDFNGDGRPDLLLRGQVLLNRGDGTFTVGPALPVVAQNEIGFAAAVGDLDRDGKVDVAYTGTGGGFVQVLLGNGDGSFTVGARYASLAPVQGIAITEIDGDGNLDLFIGNASQGIFAGTVDDPLAERFQVLLGRGDGTFVGAPVFGGTYETNSSASQLVTADFDGDGRLDALVIDNNVSSNGLGILPGDGRGAFGTIVRSATPVRASMVATADFNGDGRPDVVAAGINASALPIVAVLINQGGGRFAAERDYALPNYPTAVAVGDFDGDGRMDVVVALGTSVYASSGVNGVYVLYGQADGTLAAPVLIDRSTAPISLAVADLNADRRADLAIADSGAANGTGAVRVYLGRADRTFAAAAVPATTATRFTAVAIADINGDGKQDLVAAGSVPAASYGVTVPTVYTFLGNGDGTLQAPQTALLAGADGTGADAIAIGDFNHDGHLDLAVGNQEDFTEIFLGNGDGSYVHGLLTLGQGPNTVVAADLDQDRYADLIVGTAGVGTTVYRNAGTVAAWVLPAATTTPTVPVTPTAAGDFTLTATPAAGSIVAGQSVTTSVAAMPTSDFNQTITLACSAGLPANATCSFTPSSITPSGGAAASSSLTIATRAASASGFLAPGQGIGGGVWIATLGAGALLHRRRRSLRQAAASLLLVALLASCGGSDNGTSDAALTAAPVAATGTTYDVTITATAAATSHSTTYTLVVH